MKKIIALNLKMNLNYEDATRYVSKIKNKISDKYQVVFFPSLIYLDMFKKAGYEFGAQNVYALDSGAFTGEVSPLQIKTLGASYVIVGHSERRTHFMEDDRVVNSKIKGCLRNNLKVILCIGETDIDRRLKRTAFVLERQILGALMNIENDALNDVIIAYEPVWAIGTGIVPKASDIEDAIRYIKRLVNREYNIEPRVLYGGSVNMDNINEILNITNVDGVLVGSASIDPDYLIKMLDTID